MNAISKFLGIVAMVGGIVMPSSAEFVRPQVSIRVNPEVTTMIVMPENIKLVDISTPFLVGNQCGDNILRIKPSEYADSVGREFNDGEMCGVITVVGERHIAQYDIEFAKRKDLATGIFNVPYCEMQPYVNPDVAMPVAEMARLSWAVYSSRKHFNGLSKKQNGIKAIINNIYSCGNYFFIDYSLENSTKIPYNINEVRVKLQDKKEVKATNSQTVELIPVFSLMNDKEFKKKFRNVIVVDKLTFPEEKVLTLEINESQISGRAVSLNIDYKDILNADAFGADVINQVPEYRPVAYYRAKAIK